MMSLMIEEFFEDVLQPMTPARSGRHGPLQIRRGQDSAPHGANELRAACLQFLDQVVLRQAAPAANLARVPAVLVEGFGRAGRRLGERGLQEARCRLLRAADVREQIMCGPALVA